jgi:hypothetical protein
VVAQEAERACCYRRLKPPHKYGRGRRAGRPFCLRYAPDARLCVYENMPPQLHILLARRLSGPTALKNPDHGPVRLDDRHRLGGVLFLEDVRRLIGGSLKVARSPERAVDVDDVAGSRTFLHGQDVADSATTRV